MEKKKYMDPSHSFAVCLGCIDGRTIEPVLSWAKARFGVAYVDRVNRPGMDKFLCSATEGDLKKVKEEFFISLEHHKAKPVLVCGHCECAGNPVSAEEHRKHIAQACDVIRSWFPSYIKVIGILVNESWQVEEVG